jgi:hypothetical protein
MRSPASAILDRAGVDAPEEVRVALRYFSAATL